VPSAMQFAACIKGHCQDRLTSLVSDLNGNLVPSHVGRQVTPELLGCFQSFGVSRLQIREVLAFLVFFGPLPRSWTSENESFRLDS
jgi:hypothetical protein